MRDGAFSLCVLLPPPFRAIDMVVMYGVHRTPSMLIVQGLVDGASPCFKWQGFIVKVHVDSGTYMIVVIWAH